MTWILDVTLGRYVTSWGEATFIPVGANGLVTNALDLSALRAPGASIRDALLPTEQITLNGSLGDNLGFEVYYQFSNDSIEIDPKGSFFGSELAGAGGDRILASGGYKNENRVLLIVLGLTKLEMVTLVMRMQKHVI